MSSNPAVAVQQYGQSLWLDYIHRKDLETGDLQRRIDEEGILGVTSNPSIFQNAIGDSETYDDAIAHHLDATPEAVYETLAIEDIQRATDLFRPIYDKTNAVDGYVSLEVSPTIANNTEKTIEEAKRLFAAVNRPNLMIKIPATPAGIPAIEEAIAAGINVNVTLIFSVDNYLKVTEAYINGLKRRADAGLPIDKIASVASFFLSRIDVAVDRILENNIRVAQVHADTTRIAANRHLLGQAAIANAKLAYQAFQKIFYSNSFNKLADKGAMVQRPLWASTGTKSAAYSDTRYIDMLIGKDTVNTVPPKTLAAFIDHGTAAETLTKDLEDFLNPNEVIEQLAELNIDIDQITHRLQVDGVDAFIESFEKLLEQVEAKMTVLKAGVMDRQRLALGIYVEQFNKRIADIERKFVNGRLWSKDGSLWTSHNATMQKIEKRLGWLDVIDTIDMNRLKKIQSTIKETDFEHIVLLGMGGSSLAPEVLYNTFGQKDGFPALIVLDSTDPVRIQQVRDSIDIAKTLFIVASKSGTTLETLAFYRYFWKETNQNAQQFIAITDPDTALAQLATDNNFRDIFLNPADIGGRYSALSYFGLVPAALIGLDLDKLWDAAKTMIAANNDTIQGQFHPGITLGTVIGELGKQGRDKVTIYTTKSLKDFGVWAEQLLAESLGKEGKGVIPVVSIPIGTPAEYVTDRLFLYLRVDDDEDVDEMDAKIRALREAGHPRLTMRVPDKYAIAGEFFRWEFGTAIAGYILQVNPFDEPNVSEAKEATAEKLAYFKEHGHLPEATPIITGEHTQMYIDETTVAPLREMCRAHGYDPNSRTEVLAAQIAGTRAGDYFALLCYFTPTEEERTLLEEIALRIRKVTRRTTTIGYGPRYLHSTGQLHKGGVNNGVFFQITRKANIDIDIPDTDYNFAILFEAQATGDLDTLKAHHRRTIRIHIEDTNLHGLQKLLDAVQFVEDRRF